MPNSLLMTKLSIPPPRPNLVSRESLLRKLDGGYRSGARLFLVSAPAGYGKTTLLGEWVTALSACPDRAGQNARPHVGWVTLDEKDNDPALFLSYLIAAFQGIDPNLGKNAAALLRVPLGAETVFPLDAVLMALVNDLAAWPECVVLVLDDYHNIEARAVHDLVGFLVDHLPHQDRLVIATRSDPPIALPRLRARNQLAEVRLDDLRFSPEEAGVFLTQAMGLRQLSPQDLADLAGRTEGWAAGLQLAALSLQGRQDVSGFIAAFTGTNRFILDYLVEEILQRQPLEIQHFLIQTSILDRFNADLCDALLEGDADHGSLQESSPALAPFSVLSSRFSSSSPLLDYLDKSNLFLIPLDAERNWYRYHLLFSEFLRSRLKQATASSQWRGPSTAELFRRASRWFERQGLFADAIDLALQGQDFQGAAGLIEQEVRNILMPGQGRMIMGWLRGLPEGVVRERPRLRLARAWALLIAGDLDGAQQTVAEISETARDDGGPGMAGEMAAVLALITGLKGDVQASIGHSQRALELLPEDEVFLRAMIALDLGMAYDNLGDIPAAIQSFQQAYAVSQGNPMLRLTALSQLGDMRVLQGRLREAAEIFEQAVQVSLEPGGQLPLAGIAYVRLGRIQYELNDLEGAARCLATGVDLGKRWESADILAACYSYLAVVRLAQGDPLEALRLIDQASQAMAGKMVSFATVNVARAVEAQLQVKLGDLKAASAWAREVEARREILPAYIMDIEGAGLARVYLAQGQPRSALRILEPLIAEAETAGRVHNLIEMLILEALGRAALGDATPSQASLQKALRLAAPLGYARVFLDEGQAMQALLRSLGPDDRLGEYIFTLLESRQPAALQGAGMAMEEPLSEREVEVLRLVAQGFSNQEVADRLYVAVSTVKTHINNIYGKLGVKTRIQAVELARKLKILER